jgi:hypothetical protein
MSIRQTRRPRGYPGFGAGVAWRTFVSALLDWSKSFYRVWFLSTPVFLRGRRTSAHGSHGQTVMYGRPLRCKD